MTSDIRWFVLLPDPVAGFRVLTDDAGREVEIHAPDRAAAATIAKQRGQLPPAGNIVSRLEVEEQRREMLIAARRMHSRMTVQSRARP